MIPIIYLIILVAWLLLIAGFYIKDYTILAISGFFLMALYVFITTNGIEGIDNLATQALALVHAGVGAYVVIRGGYEIYKDKF